MDVLHHSKARGQTPGPRTGERNHRDRRSREAQVGREDAQAPCRRGHRESLDPSYGSTLMRLSELRGLKVKTLDGQSLGRVHEVHCEHGRISALMCGAASFLERLTARSAGRQIPWDCVRKINKTELVVT